MPLVPVDPASLTPEEQQELAQLESQPSSAPAGQPVNPIRDLSSQELFELSTQAPDDFDLVTEFRNNKDLWGDQKTVQKVADAHNLIKQRGFKFSDLPGLGKVAHMAFDVAKGFGKQAWNYAGAGVSAAMAPFFGGAGEEELLAGAQQKVAENIAGSEAALHGLAQMGKRAVEKAKHSETVGLGQEFSKFTPEQKVKDLFDAVGTGEVESDIQKGKGAFMQDVGGHVVKELEEKGKPVRPEEVAELAAGDPFSWYLFGKALEAPGKLLPKVKVGGAAEKSAELVGNVLESAGQEVKSVATGANVVKKVSTPSVGGAIGGFVGASKAGPIGVLPGVAGGQVAARATRKAAGGVAGLAERAGGAVEKLGQEISGKAEVTGAYSQLARDVAQSLPDIAAGVGKGAALDIGLASTTSLTPQETGSVGLGAVLGGFGAAGKTAKRVISGQIIAPRAYGSNVETPSSGAFPALDTMHKNGLDAAPPGVKLRMNAIRQFAKEVAPDVDVFFAPDEATLKQALLQAGFPESQANTFSGTLGFFTAKFPGPDGQPRRVIISRGVEAAPHESFHAIQDVLGETANQKIDEIVRREYRPQWDAIGTDEAQRLGGDLSKSSWQEAILDISGWGLDAAKEKIIQLVGPERAPEVIQQMVAESRQRNPDATMQEMWRDVLSPEEAVREADKYIARELAAENFDAVFKHRAGGKPGLLEKLANVAGQVMRTFGAEPLEGRITEVGELPVKFDVTEAVQRATPRQPAKAEVPVSPERPVSPTAETTATTEARQIASEAPDTPLAGGTKSQRELLGEVAEAIAQKKGVKINYLSAPDEPAAATTSNRTVRRSIIEAFRTMPAAARALWEKTFFPDRVLKTKTGYQVMGWAPEVFAANAHKLAGEIARIPEVAKAFPYEIDTAAGTFTEAGWKSLYEDAQKFIQNQQGGRTGSGEPLVVPKETAARGFTAPAVRGGAESLAQDRADIINTLFGTKIPETARMQRGRYPRNLAAQEVSEATMPGRVEVPTRPRGEFTGEEAQAQGVEGRSIAEVNPFRNSLEALLTAKGRAMPSFIEAIQRLNLENIKEVQLAPEAPEFRGNEFTLSAGFQPREWRVTGERKGEREEKVFTAETEAEARTKAANDGLRPDSATPVEGYGVTAMFQPKQRILSDEEITNALSSDKKQFVGVARNLPEGTAIGVRIDIPSFERTGTYVQTIHEGKKGGVGKRIGYDSIVTVDNPVFQSNERGAKKIQEGAAKFPVATVEGEFNPSRLLPTGEGWTEVGYNPKVHSYFYEKGTDRLVESGSKAISVGNSVFVKDAVFGDAMKAMFQPKQIADDVARMSPEEFRRWSVDQKGGFTSTAYEVGKNADSQEFVDSLKENALRLNRTAMDKMQSGEPFEQKMNDMMALASQAQFFNEAWQYATGEGSGGESARKAGFEPKFKAQKAVDTNPEVSEGASMQAQPEYKKIDKLIDESIVPTDRNTNNAWGFGGMLGKEWKFPNGYAYRKGRAYFRHLPDEAIAYGVDADGVRVPVNEFLEAVKPWIKGQAQPNVGPGKTQAQPKFNEELERIKSGEASGQTFTKSGDVWTAEKDSDIVTLASVNIPAEDLTAYSFKKAIAPYRELLDNPDVVTGVFAFNKDGKRMVSIDVNAVVPQEHRQNSLKFAAENNQISIFDAVKKEEVSAGGTGETRLDDPQTLKAILPDLLSGKPVEGALRGLTKHLSVDGSISDKPSKGSFSITEGPTAVFVDGPERPLSGKQRKALLTYHGDSKKALLVNNEELVGADTSLMQERRLAKRAIEENLTLKPGSSGFARTWILPNGKPVSTGGQLHHEWLKQNTDIPGDSESVSRVEALKKGYGRVNYMQNSGRLTVEARAQDWPEIRDTVTEIVRKNADSLDNATVTLFDDNVENVVASGRKQLFNFDTAEEKLVNFPLLGETPTARKELGPPEAEGLREDTSYNPREDYFKGQAQPEKRKEEEKRKALSGAEVAKMSQKELNDYYTESAVPTKKNGLITSDIIESPLYKQAHERGGEEAAVKAFGDKLVEFAEQNRGNPVFEAGASWYTDFSGRLKKEFGKLAPIFAELLAATSPKTNVEQNFKYAFDALEGLKAGRFNKILPKFEEGLGKIKDGSWKEWYDAEAAAGNVAKVPKKISPASFLAHWIDKHDLKPKQTNGKKFGSHGRAILQVLARNWLQSQKGPKTRNFLANLLGYGHEATIDVWADRTMRRLGYSGFEDRWRILPINGTGVKDVDFQFAQLAFRNAAERLNMNPDDLQGALWFAEKQLWSDKNWSSKLDLGDFRNELRKIPTLRAKFEAGLEKERAAEALVEPRNVVK